MTKKIFNQKGALLIEILLAVTVGAMIIGAVSGLVYVSSKSGQNSGAKSASIALAEEALEAMQSISETDWHSVYLPPTGDSNSGKGDAKDYFLYKNGAAWALSEDSVYGNITMADGSVYARKIHIDNVNRRKTEDRKICTAAEGCLDGEYDEDSSTQKIKIVVSKNGSADTSLEEYFTRWKNSTFSQSDWSGGSGQADFSDPLKYDLDDGNIDTTVPGSLKLKSL